MSIPRSRSQPQCNLERILFNANNAKGITDPRVECWCLNKCLSCCKNGHMGHFVQDGKGGGDFFLKLHCRTPHMMIFVRGGKLCKEIARVENDKRLQKKIHPSPPGSRNNEGSGQKGWQLTAVYIIKARNTDQQFRGTAIGTTGPVEAKLASLGDMMGLVVGAFGGCSEDLHTLIVSVSV